MRIVPAYDDPLKDLWHTRGLGASAAEVIMKGRSKYKTAVQLWDHIYNHAEREEMSWRGQLGLDSEPRIQELWEERCKQPGESLNVIDDEFDFLRAQIDWRAWDGSNVADFKTKTSAKGWETVEEFGHNNNFIVDEGPLSEWWMPAQHQLMILDAVYIMYVVYFPQADKILPFIIRRNDQYIAKYRLAAVSWWKRHIVDGEKPPRIRLTRERALKTLGMELKLILRRDDEDV